MNQSSAFISQSKGNTIFYIHKKGVGCIQGQTLSLPWGCIDFEKAHFKLSFFQLSSERKTSARQMVNYFLFSYLSYF